MKKLGKLSINPEKIIKNEELVNLRGGYGPCCKCWGAGYIVGTTKEDCPGDCLAVYNTSSEWEC